MANKARPCEAAAGGGCVDCFACLWGHGQRVINNFCHLAQHALGAGRDSLRLDAASSGITTYGNILWNVASRAIDNDDGHDKRHFGNIGIEGHQMGSLSDSDFWGSGPGSGFGHACTQHTRQHGHTANPSDDLIASYLNSPAWAKQLPEIRTRFSRTSWLGPNGPTPSQPVMVNLPLVCPRVAGRSTMRAAAVCTTSPAIAARPSAGDGPMPRTSRSWRSRC